MEDVKQGGALIDRVGLMFQRWNKVNTNPITRHRQAKRAFKRKNNHKSRNKVTKHYV